MKYVCMVHVFLSRMLNIDNLSAHPSINEFHKKMGNSSVIDGCCFLTHWLSACLMLLWVLCDFLCTAILCWRCFLSTFAEYCLCCFTRELQVFWHTVYCYMDMVSFEVHVCGYEALRVDSGFSLAVTLCESLLYALM